MNPCEKCPYEWVNLKDNSSCRDECREHQAWLLRPIGKPKDNMADTLLYGPRIEASPK